jgi:hypothetical protein
MSQPKTENQPSVDLASLTWADVSHWTTKNYDFEYDVTVMYQPSYITDHRIGTSFHAEGKPYPIWINYSVIGHQLLIWSKRLGPEFTDFLSSEVIDLRKVDLMTRPVVTRKQSGFLFVSERPVYAGEQFYHISNDPSMPAYMKAFTLRFPESKYVYQWEDCVKFSSSLKWRINKLRLPSPEHDDEDT